MKLIFDRQLALLGVTVATVDEATKHAELKNLH